MSREPGGAKLSVGMYTTVGDRCGIADYARALTDALAPTAEVATIPLRPGGLNPVAIVRAGVRLSRKDVAHVHIRHIWPMPKNMSVLLKGFKHILVPEMNMGQLKTLLRDQFLVDAKSLTRSRMPSARRPGTTSRRSVAPRWSSCTRGSTVTGYWRAASRPSGAA